MRVVVDVILPGSLVDLRQWIFRAYSVFGIIIGFDCELIWAAADAVGLFLAELHFFELAFLGIVGKQSSL